MNYSWEVSSCNRYVNVYKDNKLLFGISISEIIGSTCKQYIHKLVKEADNTPWLTQYHHNARQRLLEEIRNENII